MKDNKTISHFIAFLLLSIMIFILAACGDTGNAPSSDTQESEGQITDVSENETDENTGARPSDVSNIVEQADVPLITLNNGVQMPQLWPLCRPDTATWRLGRPMGEFFTTLNE